MPAAQKYCCAKDCWRKGSDGKRRPATINSIVKDIRAGGPHCWRLCDVCSNVICCQVCEERHHAERPGCVPQGPGWTLHRLELAAKAGKSRLEVALELEAAEGGIAAGAGAADQIPGVPPEPALQLLVSAAQPGDVTHPAAPPAAAPAPAKHGWLPRWLVVAAPTSSSLPEQPAAQPAQLAAPPVPLISEQQQQGLLEALAAAAPGVAQQHDVIVDAPPVPLPAVEAKASPFLSQPPSKRARLFSPAVPDEPAPATHSAGAALPLGVSAPGSRVGENYKLPTEGAIDLVVPSLSYVAPAHVVQNLLSSILDYTGAHKLPSTRKHALLSFVRQKLGLQPPATPPTAQRAEIDEEAANALLGLGA